MNFSYESAIALKTVMNAEELISESDLNFQTKTKESLRDIVTEYDLKVEKKIKADLEKSNLDFMGEETASKFIDSDQPFWVLDPIDGTANFTQNLPFYGISLGLISHKDNKVSFHAGVVSVPKLKEIFFTKSENESFYNGKKLIHQDTALKNTLLTACFSGSSDNPEQRKKQYQLFGIINDSSRGVLRMGSAAIQISYVAANKFGATYGINIPIWDVAAALSIAKAAGCTIKIKQNKTKERYNFIVGGKTAVEEIYEIIKTEDLW